MIHQGSGGFRGNTPDVLIQVRELEELNNRLHGILARHTGQTVEKIARDTERDYFLSPEQAKAYGIIDEVYAERGSSLISGPSARAPGPSRRTRPRRRNRPRARGDRAPVDPHAQLNRGAIDVVHELRQGHQGPVSLQLLRQEPGAGPQAHRGPGRLHLRRVHQPLPGDHRGGDARGAADEAARREAAQPAPDQGRARPVRHQPGARQARPLGRRLQPLQARQRRQPGRRRRAPEVERDARRSHRLRQDAPGADAGARSWTCRSASRTPPR